MDTGFRSRAAFRLPTMLGAEALAPKDFEVASKFRLLRVASQRGKAGSRLSFCSTTPCKTGCRLGATPISEFLTL